MADEADVLSKLEAFLSGRHHVSLVELDALISTVTTKEGLKSLVEYTLSKETNIKALKQAWPLLLKKYTAAEVPLEAFWLKSWRQSAQALPSPSPSAHAYLSLLAIVLHSQASLKAFTNDEPAKLKDLLCTIASLVQSVAQRRSTKIAHGLVVQILRLSGVLEASIALLIADNLDKYSAWFNVVVFHLLHDSAAKKLSPSPLPALVTKLADIYCENIVSARVAPSASAAHAFDTYLKEAITSQILTEKLFPAIERMIPRTPDCLPHIAQGLVLLSQSKNVELDFVTGSGKILASVTEYIVSSVEASRDHATSIIRSLCFRIKDAKALTPLMEKLNGLLNKQLNNIHERLGLFSAVDCVARASPVAAEIVDSIFPALLKAVDKEKSKDVMVPAIQAVSAWVSLAPTKFFVADAPLLQTFNRGLGDSTKETVYLHLLELHFAIMNVKDASTLSLGPLIKTLTNFVVSSKTKPAVANEALLSMAVLQKLAAAGHADSAKALESEKLWSIGLDATGESFWRSPDAISRAKDINTATNGHKAQHSLISLAMNGFISSPTLRADPRFTSILSALLLHENPSYQQLARGMFQPIHTTSVEVSREFSAVLLNLLEEALLADSHKHEDLRSTPNAFAHVFRLILSPNLEVEKFVGRIVLIAHHPFLEGRHSADLLGLVASHHSVNDLIAKSADAIFDYLLSNNGLQSTDAFRVQAAQKAIARLFTTPLSQRAVAHLIHLLKFETCLKWLNFTTAQVGIYHTPEDQTYANIVMDEVPEPTLPKNIPKGQDERDLKKKAAEAKKKALEQAQAKYDKQSAEALASESAVRQLVAPVHQDLSHGICILHEVAVKYPKSLLEHDAFVLSMVMDTVAALARYETELQTLTVHVVQWLVKGCFDRSKYLTSHDSHLGPAIVKPIDSDLQAQVIEDLDQNAKGALDSASWAIFQPIAISAITPIQWIVGQGYHPNKVLDKERGNTESAQHMPRHVQQLAFNALDHNKKHVNPSMTQCLLTALDASPTFSESARTVLVEAAPHFSFTVEAHKEAMLVLVSHLDHANAAVRLAVLDCLVTIPKLPQFGHHDLLSSRLWKTRFDTEADNSDLAVSLYKAYSAEHPLGVGFWELYVPLLSSSSEVVRSMAAKATVGAMNLHPETRDATIEQIIQYHSSHYAKPDDSPANARAVARSTASVDVSEGKDWYLHRFGAAALVTQLGQLLEVPEAQVTRVFQYLINTALLEANTDIYAAFVDAGVHLIGLQGAKHIGALLSLFEQQLAGPAPQTPIQHRVREAVVIFLGTTVQHLPSSDDRVDGVVKRLVEVLKTPSEPVQRSVATCLEQITERMPDRADSLVQTMLKMVFEPGKDGYAVQRGGAWGLGGVVRGVRPIYLHKTASIVEQIDAGFNNRQDINAKMGAALALECLSVTLGRGFEPWVLHFVPHLMAGLGEGHVDAREVTLEASRAIMGQLSANGVRLVLPTVLRSLDDSSSKWKSRVGAIELVGTMGNCQPQTLGQCLPQIVPRLSSLLADPHVQVQKVAKDALEAICSTIHNPEVSRIVPILLKAIDDPNHGTLPALDTLSSIDFVSRIDNASLSLIMPVLERALKSTLSETKKKSTKIIGIMCNLTESRALAPYHKNLSDQLKLVLADAQPITRTMAAHALGQLVKGLDTAAEIVPYLMDTMKNETTGVIERVGAAQGLAHVISHMEMTGFRTSLLPRILSSCDSTSAAARQGYLGVFQFLPEVLSSRFEPLLEVILPVIIKGLSDEHEMVRDSALSAGQAIVKTFGDEKVDVLVPPLQAGLFNKNWRIRMASIQLLGDLLYQISGAAENFATKDISKMLEGERAQVLASLYVLRLDPMGNVAGQALTVWKMLVMNTPKTLKMLMPMLMTVLLKLLAGDEEERDMASEALSDLVNKLGDRVLSDVIPILEKELDSATSETRVGICYGLASVLEVVPKHHIHEYFDLLLPTITKALCDRDPTVRSSAAGAFDGLYRGVGDKAISECLPVLLGRMEDPDHEVSHSALQGVQQLLVLRSQLILPILLPKLTTLPMTTFNAKALASISEVAGGGLTPFLANIIPLLVRLKFSEPAGSANVAADPEVLTRALHSVVLSAEGSGLGVLLDELYRFTSDVIPTLRIAALDLMSLYAKNKGKSNPPVKGWREQTSAIIGLALKSYHDRDDAVVQAAIGALGEIMATVDIENVADSPINYIQTINDTIDALHVPDTLEGFNLAGGLAPLLPIFVAAMRTGSSELREQVSIGIRAMVSKTSTAALTAAVLQTIAGPLIRILTEPNLESRIRADILRTLNLLVERGGENLKQFATTLQVTYIKAISATYKPTREQAAIGLGCLIGLGSKPDFLIKALAPALKTAALTKPEECLSAIAKVYSMLKADVMEATATQIREAILPLMEGSSNSGHTIRSKAAEAMAATLRFLDPQIAVARMNSLGLIQGKPDFAEAGLLTLYDLMLISPQFGTFVTQSDTLVEDIKLSLTVGDTAFIRGAAGQALGYLMVFVDDDAVATSYARVLAEALDEDESVDVKICVLNAIRAVAKATPEKAEQQLAILVPAALQRVKKSILSLKYAAERALYHLLQIRFNPGLHQQFATTLPESHTKTFLDFCKVVLSSLPEDSDDEEAYDEYAE